MGAVKVDIYQSDRKYYDTSLSSENDIYELLWIIDVLVKDIQSGNVEAIAIYTDFQSVLEESRVCNKVLDEYIKIQLGIKPLKLSDYEKSMFLVIGERLGLEASECESSFHKSILEIKRISCDRWEQYINNKYKNKLFDFKETKHDYLESDISDEVYWQNDYIKKYVVPVNTYQGKEYPQDLQGLIDIQVKNHEKIKELNKSLSVAKDNKDKKIIREEIKKRTTYEIDINKDISILKQHYNIPIAKTNKKGQTIVLSTTTDFYYDEEDGTEFILKENISEEYFDEWQAEKIKSIAKNILTDKQLVIFTLYYFNGITQKQIAGIVDETQGHIARDLGNIIKKIQKNI